MAWNLGVCHILDV
jgi:hypothetical protein